MWLQHGIRNVINQTCQHRRVKHVAHQRLTASSTVKRHDIKGFNVAAMWHPSRHQAAASPTTSHQSLPFSAIATDGYCRPIIGKLKKNPFFQKTLKNRNKSTKTPKITKKKKKRWKGLDKIFQFIPNLHQKTNTQKRNEKKKYLCSFSLCFFFSKKSIDAQRTPY